jgi:hypothetical protein
MTDPTEKICLKKREGVWYLTTGGKFPPNGFTDINDAFRAAFIVNVSQGMAGASVPRGADSLARWIRGEA